MRGKLVVGNWKMNGGLASNAALLDAGQPVDLDDRGEMVYHGPVLGVMWAR